jgi:polyisoprenoid-binding protein YceI
VEVAGVHKDPWGGTRTGLSAKATIDRKEFGLTWNAALETGGVLVGDKVKIEVELEAILQQAPVAAAQ